jgi:antitoxin component HigA of HigAB toxin-antitoxin module
VAENEETMRLIDSLRMDKTVFSVTTFSEQDEEEKRYWLAKTPYERMEAIEVMRQIMYGYDPSTTRLARVFAVTERASS